MAAVLRACFAVGGRIESLISRRGLDLRLLRTIRSSAGQTTRPVSVVCGRTQSSFGGNVALKTTFQTGDVLGSNLQHFRLYSSDSKLMFDQIRQKVLDVCKAFDKINADKLTEDSHFMNDLGLDSLDQVELVMAMEDEFGFEIPDAEAEKLLRPADIVKYIADKKDIHE